MLSYPNGNHSIYIRPYDMAVAMEILYTTQTIIHEQLAKT